MTVYVVGSDALMYWVGAVIVTLGPVRSIVQVADAGDGSIEPAPFFARALNVCVPARSVPSVSGLEHADHDPPSSLHSNVAGL